MNYLLDPLKSYAEFEGRATRKQYWYFFAGILIISFILGAIEGFLGLFPDQDDSVLGIIFQFVILVPSVAIGVRRVHDLGKSGWFSIIPFYNLYLFCLQGENGPNKYGPDPRGGVEQSAGIPPSPQS